MGMLEIWHLGMGYVEDSWVRSCQSWATVLPRREGYVLNCTLCWELTVLHRATKDAIFHSLCWTFSFLWRGRKLHDWLWESPCCPGALEPTASLCRMPACLHQAFFFHDVCSGLNKPGCRCAMCTAWQAVRYCHFSCTPLCACLLSLFYIKIVRRLGKDMSFCSLFCLLVFA